MSNGYSLNGVCFATPSAALTAYKLMFPQTDANSVNDLVSASVTSPALPSLPVLSYSILSRQTSSNTLASRTGSFSLQVCSLDEYSTAPMQSVLLLVACVVLFALGFKGAR